MPVFNSDTQTITTAIVGNDAKVNVALLGKGSIGDIATSRFFAAQTAAASQTASTGDVAYNITGTLNLQINGNFFDYTDGSVYTATMGMSMLTYVGTLRGWFRTLPDGNITPSTYYDGINDVDPSTHPGYDTGETVMESKTVYNGEIQQYQWAGLTQVRLVNDNITLGAPGAPITNQRTQYGNQDIITKGNNSETVHGNTFDTVQGDKIQMYLGATHTSYTWGMSQDTKTAHDYSGINKRLKAAESTFNSSLSSALQGVTPPATYQEPQWGQLVTEKKALPPRISFDITGGMGLAVNANVELLAAAMRNAMSVVGFSARVFDLNEKQGEALLTFLQTKLTAFSATVKAFCARLGALFLGVPRIIPVPAPAAAEAADGAGAAAAATVAADVAAPELSTVATRLITALSNAGRLETVADTAQEAATAARTALDSAAVAAAPSARAADAAASIAAMSEAAAADAAELAAQAADEAAQAGAKAAQTAQDAAAAQSAAEEAAEAAQQAADAEEAATATAYTEGTDEAAADLNTATQNAQEAANAAQQAAEDSSAADAANQAAQNEANQAALNSQTAGATSNAAAAQAQADQAASAAADAAAAGPSAAKSAAQEAANAAQAKAAAAAKSAQQAAGKAASASTAVGAEPAGKAAAAGLGTVFGGGGIGVGAGLGAAGTGNQVSDSQLGGGEIGSETDDSGFDIG